MDSNGANASLLSPSTTLSPVLSRPTRVKSTISVDTEHLESLLSKTKYTDVWELHDLLEVYGYKELQELDRENFDSAMSRLLNCDSTDARVKPMLSRLFALFDIDGNGTIDYEEFAIGLSSMTLGKDDDKLAFFFDTIDLDGNGTIDKEEFSHFLSVLWGNDIAKRHFNFAIDEHKILGLDLFVDHFFKQADLNGDGVIDRDEFRLISKEYTYSYRKILEFQTGGHVDAFKALDGGKIRKDAGAKEKLFYDQLLAGSYASLKRWVPECAGTGIDEDTGKHYVIMEDLTHGMERPCVMDVKMGTTSAGEDATEEKRLKMEKKDKSSTTHQLGMRITGMKVWNAREGAYVRRNKSWGRAVKVDEMSDALRNFFHDGESLLRGRIVAFLELLDEFAAFMSEQGELRFYSSSILFVYDYAGEKIRIKMIDFAHVFPIAKEGGKDERYMVGLNNLREILRNMKE